MMINGLCNVFFQTDLFRSSRWSRNVLVSAIASFGFVAIVIANTCNDSSASTLHSGRKHTTPISTAYIYNRPAPPASNHTNVTPAHRRPVASPSTHSPTTSPPSPPYLATMSASGSGVHVLDPFYLAITLLITLAYQLFFFAIAWSFKFDKVTDFAGGTNFVVLAVVTLALSSGNGSPNARQVVDSLFIMLWGARLSAFLLFRILKTGKDDRFDDKRDQFWSFAGFWVFQMM